MKKIRVIFKNQTSGEVEEASLEKYIARGEIAAFCGPAGWISVGEERKPLGPELDKKE